MNDSQIEFVTAVAVDILIMRTAVGVLIGWATAWYWGLAFVVVAAWATTRITKIVSKVYIDEAAVERGKRYRS